MHKLDFYLLYFGLVMAVGKTCFFNVIWSTTLSIPFENKKKPLVLLFASLLSITFISVYDPYFYLVNAYNSVNNFAMQSQSGTISDNCGSNFSIQTQSSSNGKSETTTKNTCNDGSTLSSSSSSSNGILSDNSGNLTMRGTIVSSEYNQKDGVIANSVFGNWSLISKDDHSIDFKSSFTLQPIIYGYNDVSSPKTFNGGVVSPGISNNTVVYAGSQSDKTKNQYSNTTSYSLSNFNVYSVQQQNSDKTYSGYIDVAQVVHSNDLKKPDQTKIYKKTSVSISIMDSSVLFINFDKNSNLFDEFKDIPLVGLVQSGQK
jgi:hypothetical protein